MQPANCRVRAVWKGILGQRFEPNGATLFSHFANDWMQHYPQFQFLISDWWMFCQQRTARLGRYPEYGSLDGFW